MSSDISIKKVKSEFKIKLTSATVDKLNEVSGDLKPIEKSPIIAIESENLSRTTQSNVKVTLEHVESADSVHSQVKKNISVPNQINTDDASTSCDNKSLSKSWGQFEPYITFEDDKAIYTDPSDQTQYVWSDISNTWVPRVSKPENQSVEGRVYSYENDRHIYTDTDGSKFFWDENKKAWIPNVDDDFLAYYQMSYGFVDNTSDKPKTEDKEDHKKEGEKSTANQGVKRKSEPQWFDASAETNTKVYVSNLPQDITEEDFVNFMQKCGLVMRDPSTQKMKVKLYIDKEQNCFKGDALCTYIKIESVDLALKLLDGSDYKGHKIKVERAHFQLKGEYNPTLKPKKKKKKEIEKIKRMQEKLFDWRPEKIIGERSKHERVVIVKNLFNPSDFDKEVQLILDYQQDMREECSKCGEVRKVVIYDRHPDGVAQITMKEPEEADAVVQLINGRWFGKRKLTAEIWDGRTKYRIAETDADLSKRVEKWDKFLESDPDKASTDNKSQKDEQFCKIDSSINISSEDISSEKISNNYAESTSKSSMEVELHSEPELIANTETN